MSCNDRNIKPILKKEQFLNTNSANDIVTIEQDGHLKIKETSLVKCSKENNQSYCDNHKNLKPEEPNPSNVAIESNLSGNAVLHKENMQH